MSDLSIIIAGAAGQGMQTIASILARSLARQGFSVHAYQDLMSRIRGGHNSTTVRVSDRPVGSLSQRTDILVALNRDAIQLHAEGMVRGGVIVYDGERIAYQNPGLNLFPAPLEKLATEAGQDRRYANAAACGVCFRLIESDFDVLADALGDLFSAKGDPVVEANIRAARAGYEHTAAQFIAGSCPTCRIPARPEKVKPKLLMTGSEAAGFGSLMAGMQFLSAYPMSPATAIMEYAAARQRECGLAVIQAEDEISAVNMALGASYAGIRSMTSTSGGGFALMAEGLSLAGMTETPIVIFLAQRPGPATGFPTRTEQGDLLFALYAGHGEFARAILAPGDAAEAIGCMGRAFNLADRYQTPVIVLGDQNLNDSLWTLDEADVEAPAIDRGKLAADWDASQGEYRRYKLTGSGVSVRLAPGLSESVGYWDSDEHTEQGHIAESAGVRRQMVAKRLHKLKGMRAEAAAPLAGGKGADAALIGFGSSKWAIREAVEMLNQEGVKASAMHFSQVYPLNDEASRALSPFKKKIVVEQNATGQFAKLLLTELGVKADGAIRRFDGRPLTAQYIVDSYRAL